MATCVVQESRTDQISLDTLPGSELSETPGHSVDNLDGFPALEKWNSPRINMYRCFAAFWSLLLMGANDAAFGALIPYLEVYYKLSYTVVSLIFLSPLLGYTLAAFINQRVHMTLGQRGVALIGPACHMIAFIVNSLHPPYPVLVISFVFAGFGNGLQDAAWNAYVGNMANANELLGILHGSYGMGAVIAPLIATSMITTADLPWYYFYYVMVGFAAIEIAACGTTFWNATAAAFRATILRSSTNDGKSSLREALMQSPFARVTWICSLFLLGYVGVEVALGGWIVTFMLRERHGSSFASGMTATGFWLGIAVGRIILGFVTPRIGEKVAIAAYIICSMAFGLVLWLVPTFYASAVAVSLQGFFLGPLFPGAIVSMTKLLPRNLHVRSIGFAAALGGSGAAVFPFAVGALAQAKGVKVLQPFIIALSGTVFLVWICLPRMSKVRSE